MSARDELAEVVATYLDGIHGFIAWTDSAPFELAAALSAAGFGDVREQQAAIERVEKVRKELFDLSNDKECGTTETRAAYRDASRAIYTALHEPEAAA